MDGRTAAKEIRTLEAQTSISDDISPLRVDGRIPIFAVSASLYESDRSSLAEHFDGWLLKPLGASLPLGTLPDHNANGRFQSRQDIDQGIARPRPASTRSICAGPMGEGWLLPRWV
jgi:hypothetical protein